MRGHRCGIALAGVGCAWFLTLAAAGAAGAQQVVDDPERSRAEEQLRASEAATPDEAQRVRERARERVEAAQGAAAGQAERYQERARAQAQERVHERAGTQPAPARTPEVSAGSLGARSGDVDRDRDRDRDQVRDRDREPRDTPDRDRVRERDRIH